MECIFGVIGEDYVDSLFWWCVVLFFMSIVVDDIVCMWVSVCFGFLFVIVVVFVFGFFGVWVCGFIDVGWMLGVVVMVWVWVVVFVLFIFMFFVLWGWWWFFWCNVGMIVVYGFFVVVVI